MGNSGNNLYFYSIIIHQVGFLGEHEIKLDDKGRARVPSGLKENLSPAAKNQFVVVRGFENCLMLYPMDVWEQVRAKVDKLNTFVKSNREFVRRFYAGASTLEMDSNDRINIPKQLLEYAGITKEIIITPHKNLFEIWDKKKYNDMMNADNGESYESLAEHVMGNTSFDEPNQL